MAADPIPDERVADADAPPGKPPSDTSWLKMTTISDGPGMGALIGVPLLGVALIVILLVVIHA